MKSAGLNSGHRCGKTRGDDIIRAAHAATTGANSQILSPKRSGNREKRVIGANIPPNNKSAITQYVATKIPNVFKIAPTLSLRLHWRLIVSRVPQQPIRALGQAAVRGFLPAPKLPRTLRFQTKKTAGVSARRPCKIAMKDPPQPWPGNIRHSKSCFFRASQAELAASRLSKPVKRAR